MSESHASILSSASDGGSREPPLVVVWGPGGIGKTSFALKHAINPAVLAFEVGARSIKGTKVYPKAGVIRSWDEATSIMSALADGAHEFKTVVIDSFNPFESLLISHVVKQSGKGSYEKMGWGREVPVVAELRNALSLLERMKYRGIQVIVTAHEKRASFKHPELGEIGMFTGSSQLKETWSTLVEWADIVGFCRDDFTRRDDGRLVKVSGARTLHTVKDGPYQAKQRYGYEMKSPIPLDWRAFRDALREGGDSIDEVKSRIATILADIANEETSAKAHEYIKDAGTDLHQLREIENALAAKRDEVKTNNSGESKS